MHWTRKLHYKKLSLLVFYYYYFIIFIFFIRLYIMRMHEEFSKAREWIIHEFKLKDSATDLSVFETNIRFVGGLLSAYALSKDRVRILFVIYFIRMFEFVIEDISR